MQYKFLVLDLDGTLTNDKKEITANTLQTLRKAQQKGIKLVLASGRPTYGIVPLSVELEMKEFGGYILSYNGGKIIDVSDMSVIYESTLPLELVAPLHTAAKESNSVILTYQNEYILTEVPDDKYVGHELFLTKMKPKKVENFSEAVDFAPDKCLIVGEPENLIPLGEQLMQKYSDSLNAFRSEPFFLEVVPKGIDKAQSLQRLLDFTGDSKEQMVAVGDGFNDLSMIKFAGFGVAMANAQDAVKEAADYITLSNEEDGVAAVVEKFIL
ncbi:MAG: Cof-type HAD-IIB family hydrolase [Rikenellaceae bacterium]